MLSGRSRNNNLADMIFIRDHLNLFGIGRGPDVSFGSRAADRCALITERNVTLAEVPPKAAGRGQAEEG
jgi:hypothetical protein